MNLAVFTKIPECNLSREESKSLAEAMGRVQAHYPALAVAPIIIDWTNLITVASGVYMPRYLSYKFRTAANKARPVNQGPIVGPAAPNATRQPAPDGKMEIPGVGPVILPTDMQ